MAPHPRKHHFLPRFYLAAFTEDGRKRGQLWVFDAHLGVIKRHSPKTCGYERGFYEISHQTIDPESAESQFARIESSAAPILRAVATRERLPTHGSQEFNVLIWFIALQHFRSPSWRRLVPGIDPLNLNNSELDASTRHSVEIMW